MKNIIEDTLNYLEVKHTKYFVNKLYNEHPHNEDMYGLKDMLKTFNIESVGIDIKDKEEKNMVFPSIYHVGKSFVLALNNNNQEVSLYSDGKISSTNINAFKRAWDGKTLAITSTENAGENNYHYNLGLEWITRLSWSSLLLIPLVLFLIFFLYNPTVSSLYNIPVYILEIIGCVLCLMLLQKKIKEDSKLGEEFCSMISEKGCDAVLSSNESTIFFLYSWSEIGLAYFMANMFILSILPQFLTGIVLVNYLAMTYGIWSVWYQATKVKKWCTLCLSVQLTIWLLSIYYTILLYNGLLAFTNIVVPTMVVAIIILLTIVTIHFVVKSRLDNNIISSTVQKLRMFQVDNDILKAKYTKEEKYTDTSIVSSVFFGNPHASYQITIVSNPYCPHCRDLHNKIEPLLRKEDLHIGVRYIFLSFDSEYDYASKIFIAAYQQMRKDDALNLYSSWFENLAISDESFAQKKRLYIDSEDVVHEYEHHKQWTSENQVHKTPYVLVNNHHMPSIYEIEDIEKMDEL